MGDEQRQDRPRRRALRLPRGGRRRRLDAGWPHCRAGGAVGTLALSRLSLNKALGVTFATAILLDATVIRLLLVPALMQVLGNLNWWPGERHA